MNETEAPQPSRSRPDGVSKDGAIHVCPLSAVPDTVARSNASHLLTWLQDEIVVETPRLIAPERHIRFHIHDISEPLAGYVAPSGRHIEELIEFALDWGGQGPIVVHCWAGISRSTAAAYTALCAINPDASEAMIAARLRHASPTAYPNRLMVRLADAALGRDGRMVRAVEAIGRGVIAGEAVPFSIRADHSDLLDRP
jgi:predicted protein tyrosine phosphatase